MIQYLLSSSICLAIILGMYQCFLSKESMYQFNRYYLIFGLVASFVIPLLTIESGFGLLQETATSEPIQNTVIEKTIPAITTPIISTSSNYLNTVLVLFVLISLGFLIRFSYNLISLGIRIIQNDRERFENYNLVYTLSESTPYVFWNYIFVNGKAYRNGQIEDALLSHEIAHAVERHTIDIIIVELLQIVCWFNPLIYFYKRAIQLNHEFIADQFVLKRYNDVRSYQSLLLEKAHLTSEISLVSNLNFYITKQRLRMMTKKTSVLRSYAYMSMTSILFIGLFFCFTKTEAQQITPIAKEIQGAISKDDYFKNATFRYKDKGDQVYASYDELDDAKKAMLPPPPPHPDGLVIPPLAEGTVVRMKGKSIKITGDGWVPPPPPPIADIPAPPEPPAPPSPIHDIETPTAPMQISAPPAPPSPPSPYEHFQEMAALGATFYLNGEKISAEQALQMAKNTDDMLTIRSKKVNGKMSVHIKK